MERLRAIAFALAATLVAAVLGVSAVTSGLRYVFCAPMERVLREPCCPDEHAHDDAPARLHAPCCDERQLATPSTVTAPHAPSAPAPQLAILPFAWPVLPPPSVAPRWVVERPTLDPPPPSAHRRQALLSVWRC